MKPTLIRTLEFRPFILAGGSGTRFWPRSRRTHPKQMLSLNGDHSMLQQTVSRLLPLVDSQHMWILTNEWLMPAVEAQLPDVPSAQILAEPVARNTAPAAGLAAFLLERQAPEAVLGLFPADHTIHDADAFRQVLLAGSELAAAGENIIVLGVKPSRPETGYGYIETGESLNETASRVHRFTEKPNLERANEFVASGNYFWNSGMFLATARTMANAVREHLPETAPYLEEIAQAFGTAEFASKIAELYPRCENISIDYAIIEPRSAKGEHHSNLYCLRANFGWNDLGSWAALYDHKLLQGQNVRPGENVMDAAAESVLGASGNYVYAPEKHVALVGVDNLVVVDAGDVLLITTREGCQDVGKLVKQLQQEKQDELI
ncbi:MAG TPA: mannose-1-phosphate guanylyltransferase [Acidobacteriaceae bacterium]|nr:mannose-1-phosphate guanylyltransferase [Acidobacteriaceae bacterium]